MSDDQPSPETPNDDTQEISEQDIADFFEDTIPDHKCWRCNSSNWAIGSNDKLITLFPLMGAKAPPIAPEFTLPAIWMVCTKCGNIEFTALRQIELWKRGRHDQHHG